VRTSIRTIAALCTVGLGLSACGSSDDTTTEPDAVEASIGWTNVADGDEITSPFTAEFAAVGLTVEPAGEVKEGAGHFHVMIDTPCVAAGEVVPNDETHRHFGDGSTSAVLELEAGQHTLCLQFADGVHVATDYTAAIDVTVS